MAVTTDEQVHLPPTDGLGFSGTKEPLHPRLCADLIHNVNNLWRRVDVPMASLRAPNGIQLGDGAAFFTDATVGETPTELWLSNTAMLLPRGNVRLLWRCGVQLWADEDETTTLSKIALYMASAPYAGPSFGTGEATVDLAAGTFNPAALAAGYSVDEVTLETPLAVTGGVGGSVSDYLKIDRSSGGMYPIGRLADDGTNRIGFLAVSLTVECTRGPYGFTGGTASLLDFCAWGDKA